MTTITAKDRLTIGCRTLCQHPGCGRPIELVPPMPPDDHPVWAHVLVGTWVGPSHQATPVERDVPVLSREAFTSAERLANELTAIATAYGLEPDGRESTRPALLFTARILLQVLKTDVTGDGGEQR